MASYELVATIERPCEDPADRNGRKRRWSGRLHWAFADASRGDMPEDVRRIWASMVAASDDPFVVYQSAEWFDHLTATRSGELPYLAYARDEDGEVAALVPHTVARRGIPLHVAGRFHLRTPHLPLVTIRGGATMMPEDPGAIDGLIEALTARFAEACGIELFGIDARSRFAQALARADSVRGGFVRERREGLDLIDLISLPDSFGDFLGRYDSKKRYNLKRQLRQLRDHAGGDLTLDRVEHPADVPNFLAAIAAIGGPDSSPIDLQEAASYGDMATRGLLRGYVLKAEGLPIACLMGKQSGQTYLVDWTRFHRGWRAYSPGTTLLYLAIEDLIEHTSTASINMGYGDPKRDYCSTNDRIACGSSWLIPTTRGCQFVLAARSLLRRCASASRPTRLATPTATDVASRRKTEDPRDGSARRPLLGGRSNLADLGGGEATDRGACSRPPTSRPNRRSQVWTAVAG